MTILFDAGERLVFFEAIILKLTILFVAEEHLIVLFKAIFWKIFVVAGERLVINCPYKESRGCRSRSRVPGRLSSDFTLVADDRWI